MGFIVYVFVVKEVIVLGCVIVVGVGVGVWLLLVEMGEKLVCWDWEYKFNFENFVVY